MTEVAAATAGEVDSSSLFVRFSFTRDALLTASKAWLNALPNGLAAKPDEVATYVHELAHYLQYTTTPYGLFLHYCRLLQNQATIDLMRIVFAAGVEIRPPLSLQSLPLSGAAAEAAGAALESWWNIENVVASFGADGARRLDVIGRYVDNFTGVQEDGRPTHPPLLDLGTGFALIQSHIAQFISLFNEIGFKAVPDAPLFPDGIDRAALDAAGAAQVSSEDRAADRVASALDLLGDPWDAAAIIESAAKAAEFWQTDITRDRLVAWANRSVDQQLMVYRTCLLRGLDAIPTPDAQSFLMSYMALCELTMFAPLLPQHVALRQRAPGLETLLPSRRFSRLLSVATKVEPMRDRSDHQRYVNDLCAALDWPTPQEIVQLSTDEPERVRNPVAFLYQSAQRWRVWDSTTFLGIDPLLLSQGEDAERWRTTFNFVIVQFADRTTFHKDKDFLRSMTVRYLEMLGLQTVMRGDSLRMRAPYSGDSDETRWMTSYLQERFTSLFPGRDFSSVEFLDA